MELRSGFRLTETTKRKRPSSPHSPPAKRRKLQTDRGCDLHEERAEGPHHRTSQSHAAPRPSQRNEQPAKPNSIARQDGTRFGVLKRSPLTQTNLTAHTASYMPPKRKEAAAAPSLASLSSSISTTTDKGLGIQLNRNNIFYGHVAPVKPSDLQSVQEYLNRSRESESPNEDDYRTYIEEVECAENEQSMQCSAWPLLAKRPRHPPGYKTNYNYQWTEVDSPLTYKITDAKPDISESFRITEYPLTAVEALGSALKPTQYRGAMPTLCAEWKGPDGTLPSAEKQCAYDGALMVEAAYEAHKYMKKSTQEFSKTQALTIALNGDIVHQYGNHMVERGGSVQYHQYHLGSNTPRASLTHFRETYKRVRNCQDWARERAARTKDDLHAYVKSECERAASPWIWSADDGRYYRTLPDGSVQWAPLAPPDSALTPPSTSRSSSQGLGVPRRRGKGKKAPSGVVRSEHREVEVAGGSSDFHATGP